MRIHSLRINRPYKSDTKVIIGKKNCTNKQDGNTLGQEREGDSWQEPETGRL